MQKVKEFRDRKGWTQSDLAEKTGLSLRTIQRIESGQTILKGHTLQVLSEIMAENLGELLKNDESQITQERIDRLKLINLSAMSVIVLPFGNIFVPFIVWRRKKEDQLVNQAAKYILNFQIVWSLVLSFLLVVSPFIQNALQLPFSLILVVLILSYGFNIWMIYKFARFISNGDFDGLKVTFQLL